VITAVDTGVLIDVFGADVRFGAASADGLRRCLNEGAVVACMATWAETRAAFADDQAFAQAMQTLGVAYSAPTQASANLAGAICKRHRAAGGPRERVPRQRRLFALRAARTAAGARRCTSAGRTALSTAGRSLPAR
jgi:hypothetical protein